MLDEFFAGRRLIACLWLCGAFTLTVGRTSTFAAAPGTFPVHGVVLAQPSAHECVIRLDEVPGELAATTLRVPIVFEPTQHPTGSLVGKEVDAFYDQHRLTEVTVVGRYVAGVPDERGILGLKTGDIFPDMHFIDQNGQLLKLSALRGKIVALTFIYTRCPDLAICPAISGRYAYLQSHINAEDVQLLEVTLDPRNDSPASLAAYGQQFGADPAVWHLVTAQQHTIADALTMFGLSNLESHPGEFIHDDVLAFIGRKGELLQSITTVGWSPNDVLATLAQYTGLQGNLFQRLELQAIANLASACGGSTTAAVAIMDSIVFIAGVLLLGSILAWFARKIW